MSALHLPSSHKKLGLAVAIIVFGLSGCSRSPEARSARFLARGKQLLEKHDPARAILEFRNAARATPRNAEVYYQLSLAYLASWDVRSGVASLRKTLELNPHHAGARLRLAQLMAADTDDAVLQDARQRLVAILQDSPRDPEALQTLGLTELKLGDRAAAIQHFQEAALVAPGDLTFAATLAQAKLEQNDVKGAEETLRNAVAKSSNRVAALVLLGRLYATEGRNSEAEQTLQQALAVKSDYPAALFNMAALLNGIDRKPQAEQYFRRLSDTPSSEFNFYYGAFLFQEGRKDQAVQEFERLAKKYPDDRQTRTRLVDAYRAVNRLPDAKKVLTDALKKNPHDLDALLQRGQLLIGIGEFGDAQADLNRVLQLTPDSPQVHYALARLQQARGVGELQRKELAETLQLNASFLPARLDLVKALIRDNAAQTALNILDETPQSQKNDPAVQETRNWALLALRKVSEARQGVDRSLRVGRTPEVVLQDALLKLSTRDYAGARVAADEVFRKDNSEVRALRIIAETYIEQKQAPEAIQKVQEYATAAPKSAVAQQYLGELLSRTGRFDEARQAFTAAKAADPNLIAADLALAQLDVKAGRLNEARARASQVLAAHPRNLSTRMFLAQMDIEARNYTGVSDQYRKMVSDDPNNIVVLNNLAYSLAETGKYDEALKYAQQAKEIAPERGDVDDTLGWIMYRKGVYGSAVQYLKTAVSRDNSALINYHLAMAYLKAGNHNMGKQTLQIALKKDPALPEAKLATEVLATSGSKMK